MNKLTIIGNLARDPELRTVRDGISVCDFTVAVNRRGSRQNTANGQSDADFFRVTAWRQLGELCAKYLAKGRKVCVVGPVSARTYTANDGTTRVSWRSRQTSRIPVQPLDDGLRHTTMPAPSGAAAPAPTAAEQWLHGGRNRRTAFLIG